MVRQIQTRLCKTHALCEMSIPQQRANNPIARVHRMKPLSAELLRMTIFIVPMSGGEPGELIRFEASEEPEAFRLCATYRDETIDIMASNYFEALCNIREILALKGFAPICMAPSGCLLPPCESPWANGTRIAPERAMSSA